MAKRLLHLIDNLKYEGNRRLLPSIIEGLKRQGYDSHVCSLSKEGSLQDEFVPLEIPVTTITRRWSYDLQALWKLRRHICKLSPDIIHAWGSLSHNYAKYSSLGIGQRKIISLEAFSKASICNQLKPKRKASSIQDCSDFTVKPLQVVQPSGREKILKDFDLPQATRLVSAVDEDLSYRALKQLIWTVCMLDQLRGDVCLLVFGRSRVHSQIEKYCRLTDSNRRVKFFDDSHGFSKYLLHADCFVSTSEKHGQTAALIEAMTGRVPVIATDIPDNRDLITHHQNGILFPKGDRAELARWINILLNEEKLASHLAENAERFAKENYSKDQTISRYLRLYEEAA